jgi:hypothetical protein
MKDFIFKYFKHITPGIYILIGAILIVRASFWVWSSEMLTLPMKVILTIIKIGLIIIVLRYLFHGDRDYNR